VLQMKYQAMKEGSSQYFRSNVMAVFVVVVKGKSFRLITVWLGSRR
jgi:hypothetical protein